MGALRTKMRLTNLAKSVYASTDYRDGKPVTVDVVTAIVTLVPVYGIGNEGWSKWTPSGKLELTINNPDTVGRLKLGAVYYVDLSEVEQAKVEGD